MRLVLAAVFATLSLWTSMAVASGKAAAAPNPWTANIYFENDLFSQSDQNYTNGARISWISPDLSSFADDERLPQWLRSVNKRLRFFHRLKDGEHLQRNLAFSLGQLMYTPSDVKATAVVPNERPYAGFLYSSVAYHTRSDEQLDTLEMTLGIVGPAALAQQTQDGIHDLRGFDKFQGWDNQLSNEFGLNALYEHKRRIWRGPLWPSLAFDQGLGLEHDFISHAGLSLGNVATYLNVGGEYRIGWRLPDDFGTSAVRPGGDNSSPGRQDPRHKGAWFSGLHAFISLDARLVARDIFLDGNTFSHSHRVAKKTRVADVATGLSFTSGRWKVSFAKIWRSKEFKQQPHSHSYGSLALSYSL